MGPTALIRALPATGAHRPGLALAWWCQGVPWKTMRQQEVKLIRRFYYS